MTNRVFIADDELDFVFTLRARLEFEGFEVSTAADGAEALEQIVREKPNLVLLDIMMPTMNGYQVCRELKHNPETKDMPVVMLTARSQDSDRHWGKQTGADDYVTKPFHMDELVEKIKGMLQQ